MYNRRPWQLLPGIISGKQLNCCMKENLVSLLCIYQWLICVTKTYQTYPGCRWWEQICWGRTESQTHQQEASHTEKRSKLITVHIVITTTTKHNRVRDNCDSSFHSYSITTSHPFHEKTNKKLVLQTWIAILRALTLWSVSQAFIKACKNYINKNSLDCCGEIKRFHLSTNSLRGLRFKTYMESMKMKH